MKVLITGALGYIGNEVIAKLLCNGFDVVANDNSVVAVERFYPLWMDDIEYIHCDVCDLNCPSDVDLVVHLAAEVGYMACDNDPKLAIRTNIEGTRRVASFNKPTLFFSTGSVYGELNQVCTESSPCNPTSLYARTKLEGENIIKNSVPYCVVRPASAFGVSYKTRHDLLLHTLSKSAANGRVELYQPNAVRAVYPVLKIAEFVNECVFHWDEFENQTLNLGCNECTLSKRDIVAKLSKLCEFELKIVEGSDLEKRDYPVDYTLLEQRWDHSNDQLDNHLSKLVNYYKLQINQ